MKFGGTSVGDPARLTTLCEIVSGALSERPALVVSAASRVTDMLLKAAQRAQSGSVETAAIESRVVELSAAVGIDRELFDDLLRGLRAALESIAVRRDATPGDIDLVASHGERISARCVAAVLRRAGVDAVAYDAWELGLLTDDTFGAAEPLGASAAVLGERVLQCVNQGKIPVITGFIGKTTDGRVTTLGRGGSDYSAALIGAAIESDEIEIWTDVPGVMSADPRIVQSAFTIAELSFGEAAELAYFGAKVLHPKTIHPAVKRGIPVRVKNTFAPSHPGTVITARGALDAHGARAIAHKRAISVINIVSARMLLAHGFLEKIFHVFAKHRVVVDLVSTSEVSVSCTVDRTDGLEPALTELRAFGEVTLSHGHALVCIVAAGLLRDPTICARVFSTLHREAIATQLLSMGASALNLSMVVPDDRCVGVVRALHTELFGGRS